MPKSFRKITLFLLLITSCFLLASPLYAQTEAWGTLQGKLGVKCIDPVTNTATLQGFECIFANILKIIIPLAGLASFVILIVGGFQYLTSGGDPKQTQKASSTITGAIIGLAATMGVWFIFRFIAELTGWQSTFTFSIPGPTP